MLGLRRRWSDGNQLGRRVGARRPSTVLVVGDVVAPRGRSLGNGDVRHEMVVGGTVPVFLAVRREQADVLVYVSTAELAAPDLVPVGHPLVLLVYRIAAKNRFEHVVAEWAVVLD